MKLDIYKYDKNIYFIELTENSICYTDVDFNIAKYLDLSLTDYHQILINNNAYREIDGDCYFKNIKDTKNAINELEPYIIITTLTK